MRDSFIFYKSFYEAAKSLNDSDKAKLLDAICGYALDGNYPELTGAVSGMFGLIKPQIDANNRRYKNGLNGGAPAGNSNAQKTTEKQPKNNLKTTKKQPKNNLKTTENQPKNNQTLTEKQPNVNDNDNVNENDNDNVNVPAVPENSLSFSILSYMNQKCGTQHKPTDKNIGLIDSLLREGHTESDIRAVIDKKSAEWLDVPKMRGYLRPSTLFGEKFGEYLAEPETDEAARAREIHELKEGLETALKDNSEKLAAVQGKLEPFRSDPEKKRGDPERYSKLVEDEYQLKNILEQTKRRLEKLA